MFAFFDQVAITFGPHRLGAFDRATLIQKSKEGLDPNAALDLAVQVGNQIQLRKNRKWLLGKISLVIGFIVLFVGGIGIAALMHDISHAKCKSAIDAENCAPITRKN
jgi:hypothetical protein